VAGGLDARAIATRVSPAVVDIYTLSRANPFSSASGPAERAAGTGMILTSDGEVLTNNHVIAGSSSIRVTIQGRSGSYPATVLGADPSADVALLQLDGVSGLPVASLADSSSVSMGDPVVALGNALGRGGAPAVAEGTVTGIDRSITVGDDRGGAEHLTHMIQTDAPIQPGDSGGPLVNSAGQVIGMITAGSRAEAFNPTTGAGFAVPTDTALKVVNAVRDGQGGGSIVIGQAGYVGIHVRDLDAATARRLGLPVTSGALVVSVIPGTPAEKAGLTQGSVITAGDGKAIRSAEDLGRAIRAHHPGSTIRMTWVDGAGTHTSTLALIAGPAI
jgi:S1-C subfamily serine protease